MSGGNRGIGLAICHGLAAMGVRVILGSRDVDAGTEAAKTMGGNVVAAALDLSDKEVVASQVAAINSDLGAMT